MDAYMVVRDFDNWSANAVVDSSEFISQQRIRQLVDTRYLTKLEGQQESPDLRSATVSQLRTLVAGITDSEVLSVALRDEKRKTAQDVLKARIEELSNAE